MADRKSSIQIYPTENEWIDFWSTAERCGLWNWKSYYNDPGVLDGIQWEVQIGIGTRSVTSFGSNSYPGGTGMAYSKSFSLFLRAIRKLVGGRKFG
jgi:hypothetical protein